VGSVLWAGLLPIIGYSLGSLIPSAERYIHIIILAIIFVSVLPSMAHVLGNTENRKKLKNFLKLNK
jgi:membrane protein DedA with SNARE-associated domain